MCSLNNSTLTLTRHNYYCPAWLSFASKHNYTFCYIFVIQITVKTGITLFENLKSNLLTIMVY